MTTSRATKTAHLRHVLLASVLMAASPALAGEVTRTVSPMPTRSRRTG